MSYQIQRLRCDAVLGEGPHWDAKTHNLYYVDMVGDTLNKYNPLTNQHTKASLGITTSFIIPLEGTTDQFLISLKRDIAIVTWDGVSDTVSNIEKIAEVDTDVPTNRLNDGKADPTGTLWTGTMDNNLTEAKPIPNGGSFYSLSNKRELKRHFTGVHISNGLSWSSDLKFFYYIDSMPRSVDQFDCDIQNQLITNRQSIFSFDKHNIEGIPDGQAIDVNGNLWVAVFNGAKVIQIDPRRPDTLLRSINFPAKQVTSVAFGGKNLDELYVTTARVKLFGETLVGPENGALYRVTGLGVKGYDGTRVKL